MTWPPFRPKFEARKPGRASAKAAKPSWPTATLRPNHAGYGERLDANLIVAQTAARNKGAAYRVKLNERIRQANKHKRQTILIEAGKKQNKRLIKMDFIRPI